ncbi:ABC transporter ATP-binding protein [Pseudoalteromonas phenolica]|uniref:ABC transporter ATP-binding protein n=1 Tax=Pseudoalteromonas phenolica TaxID=161398 RepID=A0A4Q7IKE7_9GAMM|nr:ABC transporter ATP-binding protein [Pseudoalteromonas phenolica]RZQ52350.1 ABC transporter ATP-binding protein [Pseudoalteromonas phenolica]
MNNKALLSMLRVINHAELGKKTFLVGMTCRVIERVLEILPILFCFYWVNQAVLNPVSSTDSWLISAQDYFLVLLVIFLVQLIFSYFGQLFSFSGSYRIMQSYRVKLLNKLRLLPLSNLTKAHSGNYLRLFQEDIKRVEGIFSHVAPDLISALVAPLLILIAFTYFAPWYGGGVLLAIPIAMFGMYWTRRKFQQVIKDKHLAYQKSANLVSDYLEALKTLRLFAKTAQWLDKIYAHLEMTKQQSMRLELWGAGPVVIYKLLLELALVFCILGVAIQFDDQQGLVTGTLCLFLLFKLLGPLQETGEYLTMLRLGLESEKKLDEVMNMVQLTEPKAPKMPSGFEIEFDKVTLKLNGKVLVNELSIWVEQGAHIAVVGASGSGKTTLLNLIARFADPNFGKVKIGGLTLPEIGTNNIHDLVTMVFQDFQLIDASIVDNILLGNHNATIEQVQGVCKMAHCLEFIEKLPKGFDTRVGARGTLLSGGQRQRIALARALLKDSPILLLDEFNSALDAESQQLLNDICKKNFANKTLITVAHRLDSVVDADLILVMEKGQLKESGKHVALLEKQGLYHALWQSQYH